ncbi:MAG: lysophospholipid acyltransferase family protein [Candidatus Omnitrophota bacterium]
MLNFIIYKIGQAITLCLPTKIAYKLAIFISDLHFKTSKKDRISVINNLKIIFPEKNYDEIFNLSREVFRNFGKYLVDFFSFSKLNKDYLKKYVSIEGKENLDSALSQNKGVIALTAHIGNWELGGVVMALAGYPTYAIALPHKNIWVNRFFNRQRESKGLKVIPLNGAVAHQCLNKLKSNNIVCIAGDRDFTQNGIILDFFRKPTLIPRGAASFSLITGTPIIPGFMIRNPDDTFKLILEKPIEFISTGDREVDTKELTKKYLLIFEKYIKTYPEQWYMFREFWLQ